MCVEHDLVVGNKTHSSIKKIVHKKALAISKFIIADVFKGNKLLSTCFVKPLEILTERTRNTIGQCIGWLLFDM